MLHPDWQLTAAQFVQLLPVCMYLHAWHLPQLIILDQLPSFYALLVSCQCNDSVQWQWLSSHSLLSLSFLCNIYDRKLAESFRPGCITFSSSFHLIFSLSLPLYFTHPAVVIISPLTLPPSGPLSLPPILSLFFYSISQLMYAHCINTSRYTNIEWGNVHRNRNEVTHQNTISICL